MSHVLAEIMSTGNSPEYDSWPPTQMLLANNDTLDDESKCKNHPMMILALAEGAMIKAEKVREAEFTM